MTQLVTSIDRTRFPETSLPEKIIVPRAQKITLDNGIKVYSVNAGTQDVLKIEFVFTDKSPGHNIVTLTAANRLIREGTSKHSALEISEMLDFYGAYLETESSADFSSIVLYTLGKYVNETLSIFSEVLFEAAYLPHELDIYKTNSKQHLRVNMEKVSYIARKKINEVLYGANHPYGHSETESDYDSLEQPSLVDFYRNFYHASNCAIFVAGKISDATFKSLNEIFGKKNWSKARESNSGEIVITPAFEKKHFVAKVGALQSALRVGRRMPDKHHPDFHALQVLNTILGGYFGSRLMSNIREDKGFTYGIGSMIGSMLHSGFFIISTEVRSEVTQQALEEIYKEIKRLSVEPVSNEELTMVRNYMLGSFLRSIDGAFHLSDRCKSIILHDLDYDFYERYVDVVRNSFPEQLMELATKYFKTEDFYEIIAGKQ